MADWVGVGALWDDTRPVCTAVVVAREWALTARHCRRVFRADTPTLRLSVDGSAIAVARLRDAVEHPTKDLMLLPIEAWMPAFPSGAVIPVLEAPLGEEWLDRMATLAGWGVDEQGVSALRFLEQPLVDMDGQVLVVDGGGAQGACFGDSGGPLLIPQGAGLRIAGVLTGGDGSCVGRDVYVRVDTERAWLLEQLGPPTPCPVGAEPDGGR